MTEQRSELKRGVHVIVMFTGVLDSRPQNGIARVRPEGRAGWIAVVPADSLDGVFEED
jgi:hypothetical protein